MPWQAQTNRYDVGDERFLTLAGRHTLGDARGLRPVGCG